MKESTNNNFLSRIEEEEHQVISGRGRWRGFTSYIYSTGELAHGYRSKAPFSTEKIFAPNKANRIFLFSITFLFPPLLLYSMITKGVELYVFFIVVPVILVIGLAVWGILTSKKLNYSIKLTHDTLQVADNQYNWADIDGIYIIVRAKGRKSAPFLLVGLSSGILDRYDLTNLMGLKTDRKLAAAIEHYRKVMTADAV